MPSVRLSDVAQDFQQDSSQSQISFHAWLGDSCVVLFSHPADFTSVCATELGRTVKLSGEPARCHFKSIALSVDPVESQLHWIADNNDTQGDLAPVLRSS